MQRATILWVLDDLPACIEELATEGGDGLCHRTWVPAGAPYPVSWDRRQAAS
jgi:hypothetical protein